MDSPSKTETVEPVSAEGLSADQVADVMMKAKTPDGVAFAQALAQDYLRRDSGNETVLSAGGRLKRYGDALAINARQQTA